MKIESIEESFKKSAEVLTVLQCIKCGEQILFIFAAVICFYDCKRKKTWHAVSATGKLKVKRNLIDVLATGVCLIIMWLNDHHNLHLYCT